MKSSLLSKAAPKPPFLFRLSGGRAALLSGLLLAAAFPPVPAFFVIFVAFVPLFIVIEQNAVSGAALSKTERKGGWRDYWRMFGYTYLAFLIWNLLTCYWLVFSAFKAPNMTEAVAVFIAGLLASLANPVLASIPFFFYRFVRRRLPRRAALLGWVCFYLAFEWLHYNWDLTWSWITLGQSASFFPFYIQYIEYTGVLGTSLQVLLVNALLAELLCRWQESGGGSFPSFARLTQNRKLVFPLVGLLVLPLVLYPIIMRQGRDAFQPVGQMNVRIIQPNIDPDLKFNEESLSPQDQMRRFMQLISSPGVDSIQLAVLPETAIPYSVIENDLHADPFIFSMEALAREKNLSILTGLVTRRIYRPTDKIQPTTRKHPFDGYYYDHFNAAVVLNARKDVIYRKGKLVPFTERTPFLEHLDAIKDWEIDLGGGLGGFGLPDSFQVVYTQNGTPLLPLICYESQFGDYARLGVQKGAQLSAIITNDGWFGNASGYIQHAYFSVFRAIETRRDLARSANTGMSLFCDSRGRVSQNVGWWKTAFIDKKLNLYNYQTFYVRYGDYLGQIAFYLTWVWVVAALVFSKILKRD